MDASRWSARSDTRRWRRSRAAAYPEYPSGPFSDIAAFSALRGGAVAHRAYSRGLENPPPQPPSPRPGTEPSKYQRLIEGDGQWRLRDLLLAQWQAERDGARRSLSACAGGPSLSASDVSQPRRGEYQVNDSAVV